MMSHVAERMQQVKNTLPQGVSLVAVSKFHPEETLMEAYQAGQRIFGESREQELKRKHELLPKDIQWHFIGHLQTNKVKFIAPYVAMIQAVDSIKLLREIERQAERCQRTIDVLLELHVAQEDTKYGLTLNQCRQLLSEGEWKEMTHVRIRGLMAMGSFTDDEQQVGSEFQTASDFFDEVKNTFFADNADFDIRSWGMSDDYLIACRHNANMVRIGTSIFGPREY